MTTIRDYNFSQKGEITIIYIRSLMTQFLQKFDKIEHIEKNYLKSENFLLIFSKFLLSFLKVVISEK